MKYILAIDQSTSSTKAMIFNDRLDLISRTDCVHRQIYPKSAWVEHDPIEIYGNLKSAVGQLLQQSNLNSTDIACISISNQRETTLIWDGKTGKPIYNAIVWQCSRAEDIVQCPEIQAMQAEVKKRTGLPLSPYFSAAKARWIVENIPESKNPLLFGTIDSWLIWKMTGRHLTDFSNASRTQLFNINSLCWDRDLIHLFGLEELSFPEVMDSDAIYGATTLDGLLDSPVPVSGVLGDSHGALFGQQCWSRGMGKCTFGTGTSLMMNLGERIAHSNKGIATSIAWKINGHVDYVFEGNINCTGDSLKWLVDELGILPNAKLSEEYAMQVSGTNGVYLVPAFTGLGAPHYVSGAKGVICGLSRDSNKYHIVRAALESIAYQIRDVLEPMTVDSGLQFGELRVDGGPTSNRFLMQFVADLTSTRIVRNQIEELSALGAACAGGLGIGLFPNLEAIASLYHRGQSYEKHMPRDTSNLLYDGWKHALKKTYP